MGTVKYNVVDEGLISKLSLRKEQGFLSLVDKEVDGESKEKAPDKIGGYEDITRFIVGFLSKPIVPKKKTEDALEKYIKEHPEDPYPIGSYVLDNP